MLLTYTLCVSLGGKILHHHKANLCKNWYLFFFPKEQYVKLSSGILKFANTAKHRGNETTQGTTRQVI